MDIEFFREVENIGGRAFYVGGYVRDKLLMIRNKDIDSYTLKRITYKTPIRQGLRVYYELQGNFSFCKGIIIGLEGV